MAKLKPPTLTPYLDWLLTPRDGSPPAIPTRLVLNRALIRDLNLSSDWFYGRSFPLWSAGKTRGLIRNSRNQDRVLQLLIGSVPYPDGGFRNLELIGCTTTDISDKGCFSIRSAVIEAVASEFCHSLGIPASRVLSVISDSSVSSQNERCALLTRAVRTPLTQGDVIYVAQHMGEGYLRQLLNYLSENLFSFGSESNDAAGQSRLLMSICNSALKTAAHWQASGFYYGPLDHNSLCLLGETRNFNRSGFITTLNDDFAGLDGELIQIDGFHTQGREVIALCNQFMGTLHDSLGIPHLDDCEALLSQRYDRFLRDALKEKLGIAKHRENGELADSLSNLLTQHNVNYFDFFYCLNQGESQHYLADQFERDSDFQHWLQAYRSHKTALEYREGETEEQRLNPPKPLDVTKIQDVLSSMANGNRNAVENMLESIYHRKQLSPTQWAS